MWKNWIKGDEEWVAEQFDTSPHTITLLQEGWVLINYGREYDLSRYGYDSEDGWYWTDYGFYPSKEEAMRSRDADYRDNKLNASSEARRKRIEG